MKSEDDIAGLVTGSAFHRAAIETVATLDLPDAWIAAGFVRNLVWDCLHGFPTPTPLNDIDVIYFDPGDVSLDSERQIESALSTANSEVPWQVRNQARMHLRNDDPAYASATDAMRHWAETATASAIRATPTGLQFSLPFGTSDLFGLVVRPTPGFLTPERLSIYRQRIAAKNWHATWPQLTILDGDGPINAP